MKRIEGKQKEVK